MSTDRTGDTATRRSARTGQQLRCRLPSPLRCSVAAQPERLTVSRAMRTLLTILWCGSALSAWAFDFKGIAIGDTATPAQIQERLGVTCAQGYAETQICNGDVSIARAPATMNLVINSRGIVQRIDLTVAPEAFDEVTRELIRNFGNPTRTSQSVVQNGTGAKYAQTTHLWADKNGAQVLYMKYAGTLDRSRLYFSTKADRGLL
jgi:hypothetical protein